MTCIFFNQTILIYYILIQIKYSMSQSANASCVSLVSVSHLPFDYLPTSAGWNKLPDLTRIISFFYRSQPLHFHNCLHIQVWQHSSKAVLVSILFVIPEIL